MIGIKAGCLQAAAALFFVAAGCGSAQPGDAAYAEMVRPGVVEPANDAEREVLTRLDSMAANVPTTVGGAAVVAGERYAAASGRTCRTIDLGSSADRPNLACIVDGQWALVPSVVAPVDSSAASADPAPVQVPAANGEAQAAPAGNEEAGK